MLSSISWHHYLAAVIIFTASYYLYIVLRYYQAEIARLLNRKPGASGVFAPVVVNPLYVMGKAKPDNGVTVTDTQELHFTAASPDNAAWLNNVSTEPETSYLGPEKEFVQQAANLIDAFKEIDNKPEFLSLLTILIDSYKPFQGDVDLQAALERIAELAKGKLQFTVALSDLQNTGGRGTYPLT